MGWYMVKSGLIDKPDVSHFRLSVHLITAFIIYIMFTFFFGTYFRCQITNYDNIDKKL